MAYGRSVGSIVAAAIALAGMGLALSSAAEAHGRHGFYGPVLAGGFYGWGPYWGFGFGYGPWFGPYDGSYYWPGGVSFGAAMMAGYGAVDLDVRPNRAEVWVDGKYVAEARDLDGDPSYLWLKQGPHHVVVYHGGEKRFEEDVDVQVGMKTNLKVRLEKGESEPPGPRPPAEARSEEQRREPGEIRLKVTPDDASVYVDDEFRGAGQALMNLRLAPGHHRVEVARPGFRTAERQVEVEAGRTVDLDIALERP